MKGYSQFKLERNVRKEKGKGSGGKEEYPKMFKMQLKKELFRDLRGKLDRFITEVNVPFNKKGKTVIVIGKEIGKVKEKGKQIEKDEEKEMMSVSADEETIGLSQSNDMLYENIRRDIDDIEAFMSSELYKQKEKLKSKTIRKLEETAVLNDEYITMKLRDNKDLLCAIHNALNQMNKLIKLYKDLQKRNNDLRINNDFLSEEIHLENNKNVAMIKNVFYYKSNIREAMKNIDKLKAKIASYDSEINKDKKEMTMTHNTFFNSKDNQTDPNEDLVIKRLKHNKKIHQLKAEFKSKGNYSNKQLKTKTKIISPYCTITSNFNDTSITNEQKSTQYVSHLYQTINTFNFKKQTVSKVLKHQPPNLSIYNLLLSTIQKAKEHFKQINSLSLKVYKTAINPHKLINEKAFRQMITDSLINSPQIKEIMSDTSLPSITTYNRIINCNDTF